MKEKKPISTPETEERREGGKVDISEQPGPKLREAMNEDPERRKHDDADHRLTTDSPRWSEPDSSEQERGYPPEGGKPVAPTPHS
jgi:hypothetical protein